MGTLLANSNTHQPFHGVKRYREYEALSAVSYGSVGVAFSPCALPKSSLAIRHRYRGGPAHRRHGDFGSDRIDVRLTDQDIAL
ncbi:hypothetical protein KCP73_23695 [Salmonella enterica subsp. enterica]|nr:hypothetical protein KCP73_23695 [Salmonella enterica subsp. enterica]